MTTPASAGPPAGPRGANYNSRDFPSPRGPPTGPSRSASYQATEYPFRSNNNSTSTTYPRSQRFNTGSVPTGPSSSTTFSPTTTSPVTAAPVSFLKSQLNTLERIVPGGRHIPGNGGLNTDQEKRMKQLEEDADRIRSEIDLRQKHKREALREWNARESDSDIAALRSQLADEHLRVLSEEDVTMVGAAF